MIFKITNNQMTNNRALEMFQSGRGADCVIEVVSQIDGQEKQEFNVHTYVLMVNSDVFMAMFSHENKKEARESRIQIKDSTPAAVHQMLIYLYTVELPEEFAIETDAGPLMHLANKYQIKSLIQLIEQQEMININSYRIILEESNSRAFKMFQSGQGTDCVIEVVSQIDGQENEEFNVHKYVLMLNSDVFMAMFTHENTTEAREGRIVIEDSTATSVRQMLFFMYTGALPKEYAKETDAGPLLYIVNKYLIKSLVQLIEQELIASLTLANVLVHWEVAALYQINSLCDSCGQLIRSDLKMVKNDAKWLELKKESPELAFSILENADEFENRNDVHSCTCSYPQPDRKCYYCRKYGHLSCQCPRFCEY